jgi:glycosyltransferase involved in cell wall biosynthesis
MKFRTGLRPWANRRLEKMASADMVIGIPCFNNDGTIAHVIDMASEGAAESYADRKVVIIVSDGGSTDDTREVAQEKSVHPFLEKLVTIYRGLPGKGSALRMIFEASSFLNAPVTILFDADLRSITPEWVKALADPVLSHQHDFVAPVYSRYKYDATITNNIAYNLTRALFGRRVRQPIGGDFALSEKMVDLYQNSDPDIWMTDVARFGIDIWMTLTAVLNDVSLAQSCLGAKIHDAKDPVENLGPMFRQVVFPLFQLIERYYPKWRSVEGSRTIPIYGESQIQEPEAFSVDLAGMITNFREGFKNFAPLWREVINPAGFSVLEQLAASGPESEFHMPSQDWAHIVYDFLVTFHRWGTHREKLVEIMRPLYYARVASFINETKDMNTEQAEGVIDRQAAVFEELKPYLLAHWEPSD